MRSGRHALAKDFSQTNGGIVIDTSQMRNVILDKPIPTVELSPNGARTPSCASILTSGPTRIPA